MDGQGERRLDAGPAQIRLREVGLRPTRQRIAIYDLVFGQGHRHLTAERLHEEATEAGLGISLATIYNALHHFRGAGLLRQIAVDAGRTFFDTNTSDHAHFFDTEGGALSDGPNPFLSGDLKVPEGMEIEGVDVIVRLRRRAPDEES